MAFRISRSSIVFILSNPSDHNSCEHDGGLNQDTQSFQLFIAIFFGVQFDALAFWTRE